MTQHDPSNRSPEERINDVGAILDAMGQAVRQALLSHKRSGNPVAGWRDGQVEWVQPDDIPVDDPLMCQED